MENKVTIYIENQPYEVDSSLTILEAAKTCGYHIPSLCHWRDHDCSLASCRVCLVKVEGARGLVPSCAYQVADGMRISIVDQKAVDARRTSVELLLSNHSFNCQSCKKNGKCELLNVAREVGAHPDKYIGAKTETTIDHLTPAIVRDTSKCILCGRCIEACKKAQGIGILGFENRGFNTIVGPADNRSFTKVPCIQCGQCTLVCPTGALMEHNNIDELDAAFRAGKKVVCFAAPAVRSAIAEEFGNPIGTNGTGKLAAALRRLGFYRAYDMNWSADLTIMEEAHEFGERLLHGEGKLPMITSCSPGWINYIELYYPELLPHLSTCKSPQQMFGAMLKSYWAEKHGIPREDIFVVSFIPCTAKKYEVQREEHHDKDGIRDVDLALTTRELGDLIRRAGILWNKLPEEDFDHDIVGDNTGAAVIFGVTGGVMEAAVRTAYYNVTGKEMEPVDLLPVRGFEAVRSATLNVGGKDVRIAVTSGMVNAKKLLEEIKAGKSQYDFIEVMGCPGGCVNGGGQPYVFPSMLPNEEPDIWKTYREKRAKVLYDEDKNKPLRRSHQNPDLIKLYDEYLGKPGSEKAEELLHTSYNGTRVQFPDEK